MCLRTVFILISLTICFVSCTNDKERLSSLLSAGNSALNKNDVDVARKAYAKSLTIDPCFSPALNKLGQISMKRKRPTEALNYYDKAIKCQPDSISYFVNRAYAFYELNQFNKAMTDIQFIIKQRPETSEAYHVQGLIATKIRDFNSALSFSSKAISLDQKKVQFFIARARVYYLMKRLVESEADLKSAMQLKSDEPEIYNLMAMINIMNGLFEDAMTQIQIALKLSSDNPVYLNNRGFILLSQNKLAKALEDINKSISLDPMNADAYRNRGIYFYLTEYFESAIWDFDRSTKLETYVEKVHFYRGMSYLKTGRNALACQEFKLSEKEEDKMLTLDLLKPCRNKSF